MALAACAPKRPDLDLILTGGPIATLDSAPAPVALAIGGGRIMALGSADSLRRWRRAGVRVIDAGGRAVAPGLVDHHVHLFNIGIALLNRATHERLLLPLAEARSVAAIAALVKARADSLQAGRWVLGSGWSQASWGTQNLPTLAEISRAAPDHPVFLARTDGHAGWANARALALAGITRATPDPPGGRIVRLPDGRPSGILLERANELVAALIPAPADEDVLAAFWTAADSLAARGVTEVDDAGVLAFPGVVALNLDFGRYLALLRRADAEAPLPIRVNLMIPAPSRLADSLLAMAPPQWEISPRIRITHLKLFGDGALGSRGAALSHRYADDPATAGVPRMTADSIAAWTRRALDHGLGVATHTIGDLAAGRALDAYQAVLAERPGLDPRRLRIEHFSYSSEADQARAARLGILLSLQSNSNAAPDESPTFGAMRVGAANEARVYPHDRLLRAGARIVEGTDYFAIPGGPLDPFLATLTRKYAVGSTRPDPEARTLAWALNATPTATLAAPLRPGRPADLVLLDGDPFRAGRGALSAIRIAATFREGVPAFADARARTILAPPER